MANVCDYLVNLFSRICWWWRDEGSAPTSNDTCEDNLRSRIRELNKEKQELEAKLNLYYTKIEELNKKVLNMRSENWHLQEANRLSEAHIFNLQSYRPEFTSDEARQMYKELVYGVNEWVEDWAESISKANFDPSPSSLQAKRRPQVHEKFKRLINQHRDLKLSINFSDIDQEVLVASIVRFLIEKIFSTTFSGTSETRFEAIMSLEESMQRHMDPKADLIVARIWRAQACRALIAHPDYIVDRQNHVNALAWQLFELLEFISKGPKDVFKSSIISMIVEPAVRLQERFLSESRLFYLSTDPRSPDPGSTIGGNLSDESLSSYLGGKEFVDIAKCNRKLVLDRLEPPPSAADIRENLWIVCSMYPALMTRRVGKKDDFWEPETLFKEKMLVAWAPGQVREDLESRKGKGLLYAITQAD
ncbi:hypothetical protein F4775DRAFT_601288 [Biscogniauxia sp. FL1348]|nr:hypothetical protein F4775DRAFT_601288 [Biscogniauxia sp. FL1348]